MTEQRGDKVRGLIFGLAAGDKNRGPFFMSLKLLQSLTEEGTYDSRSVLWHYLDWYSKRGTGWYDTGPTSARMFDLVKKNHPKWLEDAKNISKGRL